MITLAVLSILGFFGILIGMFKLGSYKEACEDGTYPLYMTDYNGNQVEADQGTLDVVAGLFGTVETFYGILAALMAPGCVFWLLWLVKGDSADTRKYVVWALGYSVILVIIEMIGFTVVLSALFDGLKANISGAYIIPAFLPSLAFQIYYFTVAQRFAKMPVV